MKEEVTLGSGNVFADLGLPNPEERLAKAELARQIYHILKKKKLTQVKAAKLLSIDQPKISALIRGRLDGFSLDRLIRFLNMLDRDVEIRIKAKPRSRLRARTKVITGSKH